MREAAGELDDLEPAGHLARRVGGDLAVLGGDERGDLVSVGPSSSRNENRTPARLIREVSRQAGKAAAAASTAAPTSVPDAKSTVPLIWPVAGL